MMPQDTRDRARCADLPRLFQHPLLEGQASPQNATQRRELALLRAKAQNVCSGCPLLVSCLTEAVVKFDVSGFVAGTTANQRRRIRKRLGLEQPREEMDTWVGARSTGTVDREQILEIRKDNPWATISSIADRLQCSVSTVKRHLRKARAVPADDASRPLEEVTSAKVMEAAAEVTASTWGQEAAA